MMPADEEMQEHLLWEGDVFGEPRRVLVVRSSKSPGQVFAQTRLELVGGKTEWVDASQTGDEASVLRAAIAQYWRKHGSLQGSDA